MPALRSKSLFSGLWPLSKREGDQRGAEKNQTMKKKVSNRGVSRGEKVQNLLFSQRVKPTKKKPLF